MDLVYQTLHAMTVPSGLANCMGKPLFHAISPMATKEGYLVCYLPQYKTQAQTVIAQLSKSLMKQPAAPVSKAPTGPLITSVPTTVPSPLRELDTWIGLQFCAPFFLDSISKPHPSVACVLWPPCVTINQSSKHNFLRWLAALWQLLQNTAWDWWRYQNGITYYRRESCYLLPALIS